MHFRRLACMLLGAWLGGSALAVLVILQNRGAPGNLLVEPPPAALVLMKAVGRDGMRELARFQAAEASRSYVELWESVELLLGALVLLILLFGTHEGKVPIIAAALMLAAVVVQRLVLTPEVSWYGRMLDFARDAGGSPIRAKLYVFKAAWSGLEVGKAALGLLLAARLLYRRTGLDAVRELDVVDKANHRHINR